MTIVMLEDNGIEDSDDVKGRRDISAVGEGRINCTDSPSRKHGDWIPGRK